jgi:NAD(P)-dependent dehydrogenase (short-subunit alcohol dehydrogenase family)
VSRSAGGWSPADIPDLTGRRALVTGVTSGLGEVTARELARAGAEVVLAARNPERLEATRTRLGAAVPGGRFVPLTLDLADLESVRRGAAAAGEQGPLDILVNNAGVMATPEERTADGFELQLGTNHLGPFALTGLLLPALLGPRPHSGGARVVTVSSLMARTVGRVPTEDPRAPRPYNRWTAYGESKLANLLFTFELDRRARAAGLPLTAVAAHPGYTRTNLVDNGMNRNGRRLVGSIAVAATALVCQDVDTGAAPQLRAATEPGLPGGAYLGPGGPFQVRGAPRRVSPPAAAQDAAAAASLWAMSESATGVPFP